MSPRARLTALARDDGGFTLVELLATLAILLTVIGSMTVLMESATKSEVDLTKRVLAQQEARLALEMMRHEIHRACTAAHLDLASGAPITAAGPQTNVRLTPPTPTGCPVTTNPATAVTWCTSGAGSRWMLRRIVGTPTSCAGGRAEADHITVAQAFELESSAGSLAKLKVNFPVDTDPSEAGGSFRLEDSLVLRNSVRAP